MAEIVYDKEEWAALRKPFLPTEIEQRKGAGGMMLDYVSHARVRDRLLSVDPLWEWAPMAVGADGIPIFDRFTGEYEATVWEGGQKRTVTRHAESAPVGLWIKLTVLGMTKLGYGDVLPGTFNPEKQLIGDAIRNAAMNFGVAIDLWIKEGEPEPENKESAPRPQQPRSAWQPVSVSDPGGPFCPRCAKPLRQKQGAKGPFVGCTGYPNCKFTADGRIEEFAPDGDASPDINPTPLALLGFVTPEQAREIFQAHDAIQAVKFVAGKPTLRTADWEALEEGKKASIIKALTDLPIPNW